MTKITQIFTDSFRKLKEKITNSSKKKDTKYGTYESHESTHEVSSQTRESMVQTTQEIKTQLQKSSSNAKLNTKKILSKQSDKKNLPSSSKITKSPVSKKISISSKPKSTITKPQPKQKTITKVVNSNISEKKYPSGKIVNSVVLSEVERGYLELAGFKNYKDAFIGLETSTKRTSIAKKVATQTTTLSTILKKLELLQVKGVGENLAFVLVEVGVNSVQKLQKADSAKLIKKIQNYSKIQPDIDIKLSQKQLENIQKEAKLVQSAF
ncbi:MAG: helix-hairpin-helix domain-containing protein [Nanoarchaeota archaeon]|nr:helix-hairpin-helix domain-containing protein [Nanoarchaeota archaeon]